MGEFSLAIVVVVVGLYLHTAGFWRESCASCVKVDGNPAMLATVSLSASQSAGRGKRSSAVEQCLLRRVHVS